MENLIGKIIYVLELEQPFINYYAEVVEDAGDFLVVHDYDRYGDMNPHSHTIHRKQIHEIVE